MITRLILAAFGASLLLPISNPLTAQGTAADYRRADEFRQKMRGKVIHDRVIPNWFAKDRFFWYRRSGPKGHSFVLVDTEKASRRDAFDHARLAKALAAKIGKDVKPNRLPFQAIAINDGALVFATAGKVWRCDLASYELAAAGDGVAAPKGARPANSRRGRRNRNRGNTNRRPRRSSRPPATIRAHNLFVGARQVTKNGRETRYYEAPRWAPDGKSLLVFRTAKGEDLEVPLIESSPRDQLAAKFSTRRYPRPGDRFPSRQLLLYHPATQKLTKVATAPVDFGTPRPRWLDGGKSFTFQRTDRGHKRFRVFEVDTTTGATRTVFDEQTKDFAAGDTFINSWRKRPRYLTKTREMLVQSERDGWNHLYLADLAKATTRQITTGNWVVRSIDRVDEAKREVWFQASGREAGQDPYFLHRYRIRFDGTNLTKLTAGDGTHTVRYSPSGKFLLDAYSRVDLPTVTTLRRTADGALICELERGDMSALLAAGWQTPERFVAKARDGKTDIHGVIYRPTQFDPKRKYPVIEDIYAGPHDSFVPKDFSAARSQQSLAELGFIVVKIDGMGTSNRSKAFHDVCWKNVGDAGLPDRILWIRAAAKRYPYLDLDRVGIFGTSAGGQSSTGALLFHPEFYKVAVSSCGCHDNRLDKASWNEQWMGYPVGPHYAAQSNITNAAKLRGKLFLIVGELDKNVPPESTMRVVDALIKADKDFDLLVLPGQGHTGGGRYGERRRRDFFVRHLHGVEPRR